MTATESSGASRTDQAIPDTTIGSAASRLLRTLGPGLITGASDDDPSGIGTYSQAGAQLGFSVSWTMLFSYPLMVAIQEISARLGSSKRIGRVVVAAEDFSEANGCLSAQFKVRRQHVLEKYRGEIAACYPA